MFKMFKMYNKICVRHLKISTNVFFVLNKTFLRLYLYEDGLVRFATEEYVENHESLANPFIHLTNYAINRNNQTTGQQQGNISQLILKYQKVFQTFLLALDFQSSAAITAGLSMFEIKFNRYFVIFLNPLSLKTH